MKSAFFIGISVSICIAHCLLDNRVDRIEARLSESESCIKDDPRITTLAAHAIDAAERRCRTESRLRACETQLCSLTAKVETIGKKVVHTNGTVYVYDYLGSVMSKAFEGGAEPSNRQTVKPSNGEGTDL